MARDTRFGSRLKALREARGLSQEDMAEMMDCSVDTVSNLERGRSSPKLDALERLCERLDLSIFELLDHLKTGPQPDPERGAWEIRLIDASRRLGPADLAVAVEILDALARRRG